MCGKQFLASCMALLLQLLLPAVCPSGLQLCRCAWRLPTAMCAPQMPSRPHPKVGRAGRGRRSLRSRPGPPAPAIQLPWVGKCTLSAGCSFSPVWPGLGGRHKDEPTGAPILAALGLPSMCSQCVCGCVVPMRVAKCNTSRFKGSGGLLAAGGRQDIIRGTMRWDMAHHSRYRIVYACKLKPQEWMGLK